MTLLIPTLAAVLAAAPPAPFSAGPSIEGVSEYRLPNGLKVLLVPDPSKPTVAVNLTVFVGSRQEGTGEKGMAHLFEHMLFKKTKKFPSVKEELTKLGGMVNGTTSNDRTNYFEIFPASDGAVDHALELESQRLRFAIISREQLTTEMTVVRNELEMGENDPNRVLTQRVISAAYDWHTYGDDTIGARSDIENVPNERLLNWYETYYQPDNAMLLVAGKFDEAKTMAAIAKHFAPLPKPKRVLPTTYTVEPVQDGERTVTVRRVGGVPWLIVVYHVAASADPDYAPMQVAATMLSDAPSGRLYKALVETKKAADVQCDALAEKDPGLLECDVQLNPGDAVGPVKDALLATLEQFKAPTKEEVDRAKAVLGKRTELTLGNIDRLAIGMSNWASQGDWRMIFLNRDRVEGVTPADVARVTAQYFKSSNRTLGEYVPTEKPDRAEVPAAADLSVALKDYKGRAAVAQGEAFEATPKNIEQRTHRLTLPSGMKVALLSKKTRGETVQVSLALKLGTEATLQNTSAAADFAAKMLLRGTAKHTRQQVKDALDALKATVRVAAVGGQTVSLAIEAHRGQLNEVLDLVAECLQSPAFDAKEFEELRRESLAHASEAKDDPQAIGSRAMMRVRTSWPKGHPLYVGTWDEVIADDTAVKVADAKAFHARFYGAQSGLAAVVGDFDEKAVTEKLTALFGGWKSKEPYVRVPEPFSPTVAADLVTPTPDKANAYFAAVTAVKLKDTDPDYAALRMADELFGGGFLTGRIPKRLREKDGLSYSAGTYLPVGAFSENGSLMGYAIYAPQGVNKVQGGFVEELKRAVDQGFTADELKLSREGLMKDRAAMRALDAQLAGLLARSLELDRTLAYEEALDERLQSLKLEEVNAAFKKYIDPAKFIYLKVGDFKSVAAPK